MDHLETETESEKGEHWNCKLFLAANLREREMWSVVLVLQLLESVSMASASSFGGEVQNLLTGK